MILRTPTPSMPDNGHVHLLFPCSPHFATLCTPPALRTPQTPPNPAERGALDWQAALPSLAQPVPTARGRREQLWAPHGSQHPPSAPSCTVTPSPLTKSGRLPWPHPPPHGRDPGWRGAAGSQAAPVG